MTDTETKALLDTLLPGGDGYPSASEAVLAAAFDAIPELGEAVAQVLMLAGGAFSALNEDERTACLEAIEAEHPAAFRVLTTHAYTAYYTAPAVLAVIGATTSYRHPPQPGGYILPDFDEAVLATVRNNPVSWRPTT